MWHNSWRYCWQLPLMADITNGQVINLARREIVETRNEGTLSRLAVGLLLMDKDFICVLGTQVFVRFHVPD